MFQKGPERSAQRNFGIRKGKGEFVLYIDSDQELERRVVEACVERCREGFDAVVIEEDTVPKTFWSRVRAMERQAYVGSEYIVAARFFTRKAFEEIGGFDEQLTGQEDSDLHNRLLQRGCKIGRIEPIIHHHECDTLADAAKTFYYYGNTWSKYIKKHPKRAMQQYGSRRLLTYAENIGLFARHPVLTAGFLLRKPVEYGAAGLGVLNSKVWGQKK